jgi:hypothetical protein
MKISISASNVQNLNDIRKYLASIKIYDTDELNRYENINNWIDTVLFNDILKNMS